MVLGLDFWTAAGFLMFGLVLIVLEVFLPGYFIAVPGGALFLGGAMALAFPDLMFKSAWAWLLWPVFLTIATLANLWFYRRWAPSGDKPMTLGSDSLPGELGTVEKEILPGTPGVVRVKGQSWSARSDGGAPIPAGVKVRVVRMDGLYAVVEPSA